MKQDNRPGMFAYCEPMIPVELLPCPRGLAWFNAIIGLGGLLVVVVLL